MDDDHAVSRQMHVQFEARKSVSTTQSTSGLLTCIHRGSSAAGGTASGVTMAAAWHDPGVVASAHLHPLHPDRSPPGALMRSGIDRFVSFVARVITREETI